MNKLEKSCLCWENILIFKCILTYFHYKVEKHHYKNKNKKSGGGAPHMSKIKVPKHNKFRARLISTSHFWIYSSFGLRCKNISPKEPLCASRNRNSSCWSPVLRMLSSCADCCTCVVGCPLGKPRTTWPWVWDKSPFTMPPGYPFWTTLEGDLKILCFAESPESEGISCPSWSTHAYTMDAIKGISTESLGN